MKIDADFLTLLRQHCRADDLPEDVDVAVLRACAEDAAAYVRSFTCRTDEELSEMGGGDWPRELRRAVLLVAAEWYDRREESAQGAVARIPDGFYRLCTPYRKLSKR